MGSAIKYLDDNFWTYDKLQKTIWANPELGFIEYNSSKLLQDHLRENGFSVEAGIAGMPTAFVATYGSGEPTIGFLAEFDALPGLSQDIVPVRSPRVKDAPGQGCGHNLLGAGDTILVHAEKIHPLGKPVSVSQLLTFSTIPVC